MHYCVALRCVALRCVALLTILFKFVNPFYYLNFIKILQPVIINYNITGCIKFKLF